MNLSRPGRRPGAAVPAQRGPGGTDDHPSGPLPIAPAIDPRLVDDEPVTVEVVASRSTARRLADAVPTTWRVVATERPSHHPCVDAVVLVEPTAMLVREIGAHQPGAAVVAVVGRTAPPSRVVELLDAGVAICLREGPARLLAGHLLACRRRGARGRRVPRSG